MLTALLAATIASKEDRPVIAATDCTPFDVSGLSHPVYLSGGGGYVQGDTLTINHNSGYSIVNRCGGETQPTDLEHFKLIGKQLSFDIDLSKAGCACNVALYLVASPAKDTSGQPSKGSCADTGNPYYCDANKVCGQWCPEIDIMEANNAAIAFTPHTCDAPDAMGHYSNCDRGGCGAMSKYYTPPYGPTSSIINTMQKFTVKTRFEGSSNGLFGATLTNMTTRLEQGYQYTELIPGPSAYPCAGGTEQYFAKLAPALASGMSVRISYWGSNATTMSWLDSPPCAKSGIPHQCSGANAGAAIISNLQITDLDDARLP